MAFGGRRPVEIVTQKDVTCWVDGPSAGRLNALNISQRTTVLRR